VGDGEDDKIKWTSKWEREATDKTGQIDGLLQFFHAVTDVLFSNPLRFISLSEAAAI
jgi:hypothetical protein